MVERIEKSTSPEALRAATGRSREEWRELLEASGALEWTHKATAEWLVREHRVDGWWAQGITVDFEQASKGRLPGQQPDGTFSVSVTRTVQAGGDQDGRLEALAAVRAAIEARHGDAHGGNLSASQPVVRWRLESGWRLAAAAGLPNKSGTPINLTIEKLADADAMASAKAEIAAIFEAAAG